MASVLQYSVSVTHHLAKQKTYREVINPTSHDTDSKLNYLLLITITICCRVCYDTVCHWKRCLIAVFLLFVGTTCICLFSSLPYGEYKF